MFRCKQEILRDLDPSNLASVQALIDFHRSTFGGYTMIEETGKEAPKGEDGPNGKKEYGQEGDKTKEVPKGDGDKPLGPNGEKALQTERDARQALETELKQFKAGLAEALGVKTEGAKPDDVVAALQKQVHDMQRDNLVYRVVTDPAHPITDADDLDLIKGAADETAMRKLATRLAKKAEDTQGNTGNVRRLPRQDSSQGRGNSREQQPTSVAAVQAERAAARQQRKA